MRYRRIHWFVDLHAQYNQPTRRNILSYKRTNLPHVRTNLPQMRTQLIFVLLFLYAPTAYGQGPIHSEYQGTLNISTDTATKRLSLSVACSEPLTSVAIVGKKMKPFWSGVPDSGAASFNMSFPLSKFPDGTYWVQAETQSGFISRKFAIKR
jgi:hypothetical protein